MLSYAGLLVPVALVDGAGNAQGRQVVDVLNVDGTTATVYADAARTALTGAVASDATGNVSGVYAEPGVYRLRFSVLGVSYEVQTVASIDPREITDLHTLVTGNSGSVSAEATARTAADSAESSARAAADSAEAALRASGDTNETNTRAAADAAEAALRASLAATEAADAAAAATANGNEVTARAAAVLAEQNRALAAEAANAASIASNTSAVARLTLTTTATKTAAYTAAPGDLIPVSTAGGPVTVTLPAAPATGTLVAVKHTVQGGTNTVTIAASGTDHFNTSTGPTTATLTLLNQAVHLQYAGGVWLVVADDLPLSQLDGRFLTPSGAAGAYARKRMYDVRDYLGSDDIGAAINRALAAAADPANNVRPGQVVLHDFNEAQTTVIVPLNGVDILGGDRGSILRPQAGIACIRRDSASAADPLTDVRMQGFEIDGSQQTASPYSALVKGLFISHMLRCTMRDLYVHDCAATGMGVDYLVDTTMDNCTADYNGRLNDGTGGGGAGIGIGTGHSAMENWTAINCRTRHNGRAGIFAETQNSGFSVGAKIIGHHSENNGDAGIGDAGCSGLQVLGGYSGNNKWGFAVYEGTIVPGAPGVGGNVVGLVCRNNTEHGIYYNASVRETPAGLSTRYTFTGVRSFGNTQHGAFVYAGATKEVSTIRFMGGDFHSNQKAGIAWKSDGAVISDPQIDGANIYTNGLNTGAPERQAVRVVCDLTRPSFRYRAYDTQTTKTQTYGLHLASGKTITGGTLDGIDVRNNATGPVDIQGTIDPTTVIGNNPGWIVGAPLDGLSNGESVVPRSDARDSITLTGGALRIAFFTARKTETVTQVQPTVVTASSGTAPTLCRVGIYSVATNGDLTLIASTASDVTLYGTVGQIAKALSASFSKVQGTRYAVAQLCVTTGTAPAIAGRLYGSSADAATAPRMTAVVNSQTDLPATITAATLLASSNSPNAVLLP